MMGNTVQKGLWLDPRAKLFLILMCVLSSMFAPSLTYQFALVLLIAVLGVLCGKWKYAVKGVCFYAVVCVLTVWIMAAMTGTLRTMFVAFLGLFHKVYACGMLAGIVLSTTKVSEFLSAMNRIHAPKKFVITFAVMLRYIPTVQEDWHFIKDAMRMRDVSPSLGGFLSHPGMTVPLFCAKLANSIFVDLTSYKNLMISKNKIMAVMKEPEETGSMKSLQAASHEIVFDHVDFSYVPGEPVLKQASFTVPNQKLTAIVGDSGSGKSTILNLIAKYYEVSGGTISIGGRPINHVAAERVLDQISMVDQDVFLFDDTVRENIRYARPDATDAEIKAACREANCDGFIRKMEKGYDTPIGENGNLLSGGERQRLSIARAILKNSPILLLDEATASLDIENELAVKQAIANLLKEKKTVVMIAHTLSIVKNADQILVVSDGRITEAGTHKELLAKDGKYAAMWNAEQQFSHFRYEQVHKS